MRKGRVATQLSIVIRLVLTRVIGTRKGRSQYMPQDRITIIRPLYGGRSEGKFTWRIILLLTYLETSHIQL
jgi:hypothetical protein